MSYNTFTPIVTNGLVLYLDAANTKSYVSGSTTWNDLSKNGNNGTLVNGPTFDSNNSGGIVFDGSTQYVTNIGTTNTFSFIQNTAIFTIDTWVKPSVLGTAMYFIGNNDGTTNAKGFFVGKNATERIIVTVTYGTGAQYVIYIVTPYFTDTNWVNVIITSNGINAIAYKNASPVGSPTSVGSTLSTGDSTSTLAVGRVNNLAGTNWSGNIASTKIYNRALSAQEVLQNYNATKFRFQ